MYYSRTYVDSGNNDDEEFFCMNKFEGIAKHVELYTCTTMLNLLRKEKKVGHKKDLWKNFLSFLHGYIILKIQRKNFFYIILYGGCSDMMSCISMYLFGAVICSTEY